MKPSKGSSNSGGLRRNIALIRATGPGLSGIRLFSIEGVTGMNLIKSIAILVGGVVLGAVLMYCSMKPQLDGVRYEEDVVARTLAALSLERHGITPSKELINDVSKTYSPSADAARSLTGDGRTVRPVDLRDRLAKEIHGSSLRAVRGSGRVERRHPTRIL